MLYCLDLFCGCGGLSFIDGEDDSCVIKTMWAVDIVKDMLASFSCNFPDAFTFSEGTDRFLALCKHVSEAYNDIKRKGDAYERKVREWVAPEDDLPPETDGDEVQEIKGIRVDIKEEFRKHVDEGGVLDGKGHVCKDLDMGHFDLLFLVHWRGVNPDTGRPWEPTWEPMENCAGARIAMHQMVLREVESMRIPIPGLVDIVVGGPPCQGVSGLNRHRVDEDLRMMEEDAKNRQGRVFWKIVEFFRPSYALMENVTDILKHCDALYAKWCLSQLMAMGYQCRTACLAAFQFGAPQGRWRVFMAASRPEERLMAMPMPTHRKWPGMSNCLPKIAKDWCHMDYDKIPGEVYARLLDPNLMGDVLSDLPEVGNFAQSERLEYKSEPSTPYQVLMRRPPPEHQVGPD